ncbi:MAG: hypothetical protein FJW22_12750 [Acidimicrobiia bacterium]|nr:hypothetical protein [Acidimicrobiia bacterium]
MSATRRPDQAFGDDYRGRSASCALGAADEGIYRLPTQADGLRPTKDLEWFFDCFEGSLRRCPGGDDGKKILSLAAIMVHLSDDHKWSRELIAQWLEGLRCSWQFAVWRLPVSVEVFSVKCQVAPARRDITPRWFPLVLQTRLHVSDDRGEDRAQLRGFGLEPEADTRIQRWPNTQQLPR